MLAEFDVAMKIIFSYSISQLHKHGLAPMAQPRRKT
jgi:hypothetical protein